MNAGARGGNQPGMAAQVSRLVAAVMVAAGALAGCVGGTPDGAATDAAVDDGAVADAPTDGASIDAPLVDAAVDARPIDAPIDGIPIDGTPVTALPLVLDPGFSGDGSLRLGQGYPGAIDGAGGRLSMCALATHWFDDITYYDGLVAFRTTPGLTEDLFASAPPTPINGAITCPAHALRDDHVSVSAYRYWNGTVELRRRDVAGTLGPPSAPPQAGDPRALVAAPGGRVLLVYDDAVWLLDAQLAPVLTFGVNGKVAFPGPLRRVSRPTTAAPRLDVVTDTAVRRLVIPSGALDPAFGAGGVAALPAPALDLRGAVTLPDGGELLVGVGRGYQLSPAGAVTTVALPPLDAKAVIDDRQGGAYVIEHLTTYALALRLYRLAPDGPASWGASPPQAIVPPDLCPIGTPNCREWIRTVRLAWADDTHLGIWFENHQGYWGDFVQGHAPQLLVLRPE